MRVLERWAPAIFVLIWSSGFVVAKYAFQSSDVIYFLAIRLFIAALILAIVAKALGQSLRLSKRELFVTAIIGICLHGIYLGGVWQAIAEGSPAGIASVVTSMQPILVSILAIFLLKERLTRYQLAGLVLGFAGVLLVLAPSFAKSGEMNLLALSLLIAALLGSTTATLSQKKIGQTIPLLAGTMYQFLIAGVVLMAISVASEKTSIEWNLTSTLAMLWAVVVTSIIAILLLLWMLTRGSAARVSSLLYLVPPAAAIQAWVLFGEKLNPQAIIGIIATAVGVALVQKR
jgi:drug/metabolite transporter (DMT)-like permease